MPERTDNYRYQGLRRQLVEQLRRRGIKDERVLRIMETLPRHLFVDPGFEEWAYDDKPFPIDCDQTISQPYTVAFQTAALDVLPRQRVLEVGTGSGYQAAVLALIGARVFTVERHEPLYRKARMLLRRLRLGNVRCFHRDGYKGLPEFAPFDRILVTAGATEVPPALLDQLAIGGILVIPVGETVQNMLRIHRVSEGEYREENLGDFRFVPFVPGLDREENKRGEGENSAGQ